MELRDMSIKLREISFTKLLSLGETDLPELYAHIPKLHALKLAFLVD
jgi:hypothetical protein